jgi:hypothetical protein
VNKLTDTILQNRHTHVDLFPPDLISGFPFREGSQPWIRQAYRNGGDYPVVNSSPPLGWLYVEPPTLSEDDMFNDFQKKVYGGWRTRPSRIIVGREKAEYMTSTGNPLTKEQADSVNHGTSRFCALYGVRWEDETGMYETDACYCVSPFIVQSPNNFPGWYQCYTGHNDERKLTKKDYPW